jgi:uncharacterized membrane protein
MARQKESHLRSLIKGITWRILGTLDTIFISYVITGDTTKAISIGGIEVFTKILLYYGHERLWQVLPIGAIRKFFGLKKKQQQITQTTEIPNE